jgi:integrase
MALYRSTRGWGIDYRDEFGRRHRQHVGTEEQARNVEQFLLPQIARTRHNITQIRIERGGVKISEGIQLYLRTLTTSKNTQAQVARALNKFLTHVGDIPASEVTPQLIARYHDARAQTCAPNTLAGECLYVRALFRFLARHWGIPDGIADALPTSITRHSAGVYITPQQEAQILITCARRQTRLKVLLGIDAGLRAGELKLLRHNSINTHEGEITVSPSKPGSTRIVPMTDRLWASIALCTNPQHPNPEAPLFIRNQGKHGNPATFLRGLTTKGAPPIRFHDLRHTFASRLAETGIQHHVIAALLGHALRGTTNIYLHASLEQAHRAIDRLNQFIEANLMTKETTQ